MKIILCPPAQATSRARLAACCPRTSRMSTAYCAASASIELASTRTGANDSGALIRSTACGSVRTAKTSMPFHDGRFARVGLRNDHGLDLVLARRQRRRKRSAHRAHLAVERKFSEKNVLVEALAEKRSLAPQNRKRHRQIERRPFLADIRRSKIHRHALKRKLVPAILQRRLDAFAAFLHRHVRQTRRC